MANPVEQQSDEQDLITSAQGGDLNAFNALVLRYQDNVYGVTYRIMGEADSAADTAQDTFITAFRRLETYRGGNFKAWLLRIATNTCYDELRRRKRRPADALDDLPGADHADGPPLPSYDPSPEQHVQQHELQRIIENCIKALRDEQRLVIILRDIEGLSYDEVAASAGVPAGTVKSRLSRARASMRACLQNFQELLPDTYRLTHSDD
ncbi:MAG: sigma-70 family RNA polymerase sigma factor [Chloroflexi bacterium]|nr:MAG: RNA polymerase subunit sigma-24 [Phototrophicales bacterium]RMF82587.1 MAG: sigma-70 family RNA polymerase sigma factor [Chloroflexota bacterium]